MTRPTRRFVVTGASRGLGRAVVEHLRADGHDVIAACRRPADAPAGGPAVALDVTDPTSVGSLAESVEAEFGGVDVLVNNAGIKAAPGHSWEASAGPLDRLDADAVAAVLRTNVIGPLLVTRALLRLMSPGAVVANLSSQLGSMAATVGRDYAYNASKAAVNMITVTMAADLRTAGVASVAVNPGWVRTEMGGDDAPLDPDAATRELADLLGRLRPQDSGRFVDRFGEDHPW